MGKISSKHLFFLIASLTVVSIKTYPTIFTKLSGRDTWICLIFASIFIFFYFSFILFVYKKKCCYNFIEIYTSSLGKFLGSIFIGVFILNLFLTLTECASVEASAMNINFLIYTRTWQLLLLTIPAAAYVVKRGYNAVLISVLIGIFFISVSGVMLAIMTSKYKEYVRLLPILEYGFNYKLVISTIKLIGAYSSIAIILPLFCDIKDKKNIRLWGILGLLFVIQMQIFSMLGNLSTFEIDIFNSMSYPKLIQTQLIRHFGFLEAGELFVMLQIVGGWFIKLIVTLQVLMKILEYYKLNRTSVLVAISIALFIAAYLCSRNLFTLFKLLDYYVYINFVNYVIIPLFVFLIFLFRPKKAIN